MEVGSGPASNLSGRAVLKTMRRALRPYWYLSARGEDRENPHIVRELVQCGKPSCRCAREQKYRHGPYRYLRYDGYNPQTGAIRYRREYVPARELARVRALVRRSRAARARTRAVLGLLRRHVTAMEYRARRRARIQTSQ